MQNANIYGKFNSISLLIRLFQLIPGLQISAAYWAATLDGWHCKLNPTVDIIAVLAHILVFLHLFFFLLGKINFNIHECPLFGIFIAIDASLMISIIAFSMTSFFGNWDNCATDKVFLRFCSIVTIVAISDAAMLLKLKIIHWVQRYTNWIRNIAWPILFLAASASHQEYKPSMLIIGILTTLIFASGLIFVALLGN